MLVCDVMCVIDKIIILIDKIVIKIKYI